MIKEESRGRRAVCEVQGCARRAMEGIAGLEKPIAEVGAGAERGGDGAARVMGVLEPEREQAAIAKKVRCPGCNGAFCVSYVLFISVPVQVKHYTNYGTPDVLRHVMHQTSRHGAFWAIELSRGMIRRQNPTVLMAIDIAGRGNDESLHFASYSPLGPTISPAAYCTLPPAQE